MVISLERQRTVGSTICRLIFIKQAETDYDLTQEKQRLFASINYVAGTWNKVRRGIIQSKHSWHWPNPRCVVTNLTGDNQELNDNLYCARDDMENRFKEQQLRLFAGHTSCSH